MKSVRSVLLDYIQNPFTYWPQSHRRNAIKLNRSLSGALNGQSVLDYSEILISLAELRSLFGPMHIYIVNMGSSGSHWVESMLGLLKGFYNGGEIYIPPKVRFLLSQLSTNESSILIDALYLAHLGKVKEDFLTASLSNSAHIANHIPVTGLSLNKRVVLLLRNPIDIVISRTFRKNEYRSSIAAGMNDEEYLKKNCMYVERFIRSLDLSSFDLIIRYEDFLLNTFDGLCNLAKFIGIECSDDDLLSSVKLASVESALNAVESGRKPINNAYLIDKSEKSWARDYASQRLSSLCKDLNYQ
jgi:hypothetical protein